VVENVRRDLMEGRCSVPAVGSVVERAVPYLPYVVVDAEGCEVEPVSVYLRDLMLGDVSSLTCRSYGFGLLRWHRLLWFLQTSWDKATEAEVAVLVGWLREARNPQRIRRREGSSPPPGSVNLKTGKPSLRAGYAPSTTWHFTFGQFMATTRSKIVLTIMAVPLFRTPDPTAGVRTLRRRPPAPHRPPGRPGRDRDGGVA
jgi:hypothetical protein